MNYYANFINLYTELDFCYMRMLLDTSAYCLNLHSVLHLNAYMYNLNVYITFFHSFCFFAIISDWKKERKKERKKRKKKRFIVHILNSDFLNVILYLRKVL